MSKTTTIAQRVKAADALVNLLLIAQTANVFANVSGDTARQVAAYDEIAKAAAELGATDTARRYERLAQEVRRAHVS